jgi:HlyD family secretion protein
VDDLSSLLVDVQVSEVDINSVSVGQPATITFDAVSGKTYNGTVTEVSQAGNTTSGEVDFTVTVKLTDADTQVKPGMTAAVNIVVHQVKNQLLVPNQTVRLVNGQKVVYILTNNQPKQVVVTLGASSDTMSVVTGSSLNVGDLIILNPPVQFQAGPRGPGGG